MGAFLVCDIHTRVGEADHAHRAGAYRDIHAPPGPACHEHEVGRVASPDSGRRRSRQRTPPSTRAAAPSARRLTRRFISYTGTPILISERANVGQVFFSFLR